ncbi:MAG: condensation domain-containing protein, partial [Bacteroidota bacterium]
YHDRASLTAERFIPEPFSGLKGARMYKTGDLVRYMADGNIEFLGRIDHQVKVRGFRIELGEIEASLRQHEKIDEVVVVVREDIRGSKRLVAYIVPAESSDLEPSTLRSFLEERLPDYMVPSSWVVMEQLPLTPSGKIDRRALPVPDAGHPELARSSISPRTPTEQKLAEVWKEVLGLEHVGVEDNFFELGGDSILSIQLIARAKQVGFQITPKQIFQHPTISRLASIAESGPGVQAEQGVVTGSVLLTPIQRRFFDQEYPEPHHWNQSVLLEIHDQLKPDRLEATVRHMLRHHDALRMRFEHTPDGWDQENASIDNEHILSWIDLSEADAAAAIVEIERKGTELQSSLDLSKGPLIRLAYFDRGERESGRLLILIHHLVIDGVSWRILLEDFHTVYQQISAGKPVQLPAKTTSFQDWAMKLREYAQSQTLKSEAQYWRRFGRVRWKVSSIPLDHEEGSDTEESAEWITTGLSKDETDTLLREVPRILHADISALLLTPLARTFSQWTGKRSWLVDLEGHGRDPILDGVDVSRTVGWFTTVYPIILDLGASHHLMDHLDQVKTSLERTVPYGMGFGLLRYSTEDPAVNDQLSNLPQAEVSFNYLGQFDHTLDGNTLFSLAHEKAGADLGSSSRRSHLLGVAGRVVEGSLEIAWNFSTNRHSRETIERLARSYLDELRGIIHLAGSSDSAKEAEPDDRQHELSQKEMEDLLEELQGGEDL